MANRTKTPNSGVNVLPRYENFTRAELERRIEILHERGSKRDKEQEIPAIREYLRRARPEASPDAYSGPSEAANAANAHNLFLSGGK